MAKLSITRAWNEASDFVRRDFGAIFTIAAALIVLPGIAAPILAPGPAPGQPTVTPWWVLLSLVSILLSLAGALAISALAMGRENVVGAALALAFRRVLSFFGAVLILLIAAMILLVPVLMLSGLRPEDITAPTPAGAQRLLRFALLAFVLFAALWPRFIAATPVAAAEAGHPFRIIQRSWALTRGHYGRLLGFSLAILVLIVVTFLASHAVFGSLLTALAGPLERGTVPALLFLLLTSLVNAALGIFVTAAVARIYLQLAEPPTTGS